MALRSPAVWMGDPAVQGPAQDDRLMLAGLLRPESGQTAANRPLTAASGVLAGPAGTVGEVTALSNTQFTVNPARWWIQASASALGGVYCVTNDAVATLGITAQDASQSRRSQFGVWVQDKFVAGSGDNNPHWGLIDGPLAPSNPQLPAAGVLPANWLAVGEFLIPPTGQAVTWTPYDVRTGLRGGILPVTTTDARAGAYPDQYRSHPTYGLQRWDGAQWALPRPQIYGKMWRTGGFSGSMTGVTGAVNYTVQFDTARLAGGFTFTKGPSALSTNAADTYLTVPLDGFYTIRARGYVSGGSGMTILTQVYANSGAGAAVLGQAMIWKPDANDKTCTLVDTFPFKAGDRLWLALSPNATGTQYWGSTEGQGCSLGAYYEGPLLGTTPL